MVTAAAASNLRGLRGNAVDCLGMIRTFWIISCEKTTHRRTITESTHEAALLVLRFQSKPFVNFSEAAYALLLMNFILVIGEKI
jgi:hypothetical protein